MSKLQKFNPQSAEEAEMAEIDPELVELAQALEDEGINIDDLTDEELEEIIEGYAEELAAADEGDEIIEDEDDDEDLGVVDDPEVWDTIAEMDEDELAELSAYLAEVEKFDRRLEGESLEKAEAIADVWLNRGDVELKKFLGGAMSAAGKFASAVKGKAGAAMSAARGGVGYAGAAANRFSAAAGRKGADAGFKAGNKLSSLVGRMRGSSEYANAQRFGRYTRAGRAAGKFAGRNAVAGAAIGTGVLGAGGALAASRRKNG